MPSTPPPPGVYVPVPTFFVPPSSPSYTTISTPLDPSIQAAHSLHLARSGITGLVVLGSTGEAVHLTNKERSQVLRGIRQTFDENGFQDYPLIAGTAAQNVEDVVEQLKAAKEDGVQWGLVLVPGYFAAASTQKGIVKWFQEVASRSEIPVMVYHYPGVSNNVRVTPSTFAILSQHPNIVGCKLSHGDVSIHAQIACSPLIDHTHFHTFTGLGQQLLPILSLGCAGTIDGSAGFFPKSVVRLYNLGVKDRPTDAEVKERRLLQYKVSAVEEIVVKYGTVGIKECVSRILGMGARAGTRIPLEGGIPGGDKEWENWKEVVGELGAVEKGL
ncbi:dihydrodipicolinate synthase [Amylocarpus encephaloides]|uniref:Dihydrodipicolinate synthase n=1 Tax=Amylocarpus encephaloides TaxID=45428 RepID=A0A9P8C0M4_9HELO|nr:dihydrodipicolinate synthase [Amylocarpus encephaloides]